MAKRYRRKKIEEGEKSEGFIVIFPFSSSEFAKNSLDFIIIINNKKSLNLFRRSFFLASCDLNSHSC